MISLNPDKAKYLKQQQQATGLLVSCKTREREDIFVLPSTNWIPLDCYRVHPDYCDSVVPNRCYLFCIYLTFTLGCIEKCDLRFTISHTLYVRIQIAKFKCFIELSVN